jgi:hypothetical protein
MDEYADYAECLLDNSESTFNPCPVQYYHIASGPSLGFGDGTKSTECVYACRLIPRDIERNSFTDQETELIMKHDVFKHLFSSVRFGWAMHEAMTLNKLYQKSQVITFAELEFVMHDVPPQMKAYIFEQGLLFSFSHTDLNQGDQLGEFRFKVDWDNVKRQFKSNIKMLRDLYGYKATYRRGFVDARNSETALNDDDGSGLSFFYILGYGFPPHVVEEVHRDVPSFGLLVDVLKPGVTSHKNAKKMLGFQRFYKMFTNMPLPHLSVSFALMKNAGLAESELKKHFRSTNLHHFDGYPIREFVPVTPSSNRDSIESFVMDMISNNSCLKLANDRYTICESVKQRLVAANIWDDFGPNKFVQITEFKRKKIVYFLCSCNLAKIFVGDSSALSCTPIKYCQHYMD